MLVGRLQRTLTAGWRNWVAGRLCNCSCTGHSIQQRGRDAAPGDRRQPARTTEWALGGHPRLTSPLRVPRKSHPTSRPVTVRQRWLLARSHHISNVCSGNIPAGKQTGRKRPFPVVHDCGHPLEPTQPQTGPGTHGPMIFALSHAAVVHEQQRVAHKTTANSRLAGRSQALVFSDSVVSSIAAT
jgi:hypothetical protein